jgi:hypothetical protein
MESTLFIIHHPLLWAAVPGLNSFGTCERDMPARLGSIGDAGAHVPARHGPGGLAGFPRGTGDQGEHAGGFSSKLEAAADGGGHGGAIGDDRGDAGAAEGLGQSPEALLVGLGINEDEALGGGGDGAGVGVCAQEGAEEMKRGPADAADADEGLVVVSGRLGEGEGGQEGERGIPKLGGGWIDGGKPFMQAAGAEPGGRIGKGGRKGTMYGWGTADDARDGIFW